MNLRDKNVQNLLLGIVILLALIPVAWEKSKPKKKVVQPAAKVADARTNNELEKLRTLPGEPTFRFTESRRTGTKDLKNEVLLSDAPESIRARYVSMSKTDGSYHFQVKIRSEPRCMQGDMDIIQKDLRYTMNPRLLLTLENLGPVSEFEPVIMVLKPNELHAGATFTFKVPELERAQHVGLFLCLDNAGANSCKNKQAIDLVDVANRYVKGRTRRLLDGKRISDASDKMYFFHHFLIDRERLIGFDTTIEDSDYSEAERYLQDVAQDGGVTSEVIARTKFLNQTIRSMPAKIRKRNVLLNLPREDQGKCAERKIFLPPSLQRAMDRRGGKITRSGS